jgi:hypothetical protein
MKLRHIVIDGKPYLWCEIVRLRREQLAAVKRQAAQPTLFELKHDARPVIERKAADRYLQPSLFGGEIIGKNIKTKSATSTAGEWDFTRRKRNHG